MLLSPSILVVVKQLHTINSLLGRKKEVMFYLMMDSTHFITSYIGVGHMVKNQTDSESENLLLSLHGIHFLMTARYLLYAVSHR